MSTPKVGPAVIPMERYNELLEAERKLDALEAHGVDNWVGYDAAMEEFYDEEELLRKYPDLFEVAPIHWITPASVHEAELHVLNFFDHLCGLCAAMGYPRPEGVMIRTYDEPYKLGRSWGMMRFVEKPTIDLRVCGFNEATANKDMTFLGLPYHKGEGLRAVGKIFVQYGDEVIGVGPGCMSHKERSDYFTFPDKLIGKIIKIQYKHDDSYKALRQPTFVCIHPDKTTPDK